MSDLLLTFYGDDFTGSTDVLESLSLNGVETVLFLEPPTSDDVAELEDVHAVGVAGTSRSMTPEEMDAHLPETFKALGQFDAELFHYKVCSTFDSSPEIGSIGHAIDIGQNVFDSPFVPVVVAAPSLEPRGRYVLFGNLFATVDGTTYRLDRHPTMSEHPITPMTEADLRRHLGEQTDRSIGLVDIRSIEQKKGADLLADLEAVCDDGAEIVFFDGLNREHQRKVGRLIWEQCEAADGTVFAAASSGLNYAVTAHLQDAGIVTEPEPPSSAGSVDHLIVMSGSASPVTDAQIEWALNHGFQGVQLDTPRLVDPAEAATARAEAVEAARAALADGDSVVLYSARGSDDPVIDDTKQRLEDLGSDPEEVAPRLGQEQGQITRKLLEATGHDRVCVAGGDTSGFVAPALDIYALEFAVPVGPGSPLCRARSRNPAFDGLEIALKGGQVETTNPEPDYFGVVCAGGQPP